MFEYKGIKYSEAGKLLKGSWGVAYFTTMDVTSEVDIDLESAVIEGEYIKFSTHIMSNHKDFSYADWKKHIIAWRYSNDDQIAILLNQYDSEEDLVRYNKMQEWREWASKLAKKLTELNNEYKENSKSSEATD